MHAVVGGHGPALLLLPGWPQTWYAWRKLMPALAEDHRPRRRGHPLSLPVLAISGEEASLGEAIGPLADDLTTIVLPDTGHFLPDEAPDAPLDAIRSFRPSTPSE